MGEASYGRLAFKIELFKADQGVRCQRANLGEGFVAVGLKTSGDNDVSACPCQCEGDLEAQSTDGRRNDS
jgi:hypothetical protein